MTTLPNYPDALINRLKTDPAITAITTKGYAGELPPDNATTAIDTLFLIIPAGGIPNVTDYSPLAHPRFDVKCYAPTEKKAFTLACAIYDNLKSVLRYVDSGTQCLINRVDVPLPSVTRESNNWPVSMLLGATAHISLLAA